MRPATILLHGLTCLLIVIEQGMPAAGSMRDLA
jgi:hypothetical protein